MFEHAFCFCRILLCDKKLLCSGWYFNELSGLRIARLQLQNEVDRFELAVRGVSRPMIEPSDRFLLIEFTAFVIDHAA